MFSGGRKVNMSVPALPEFQKNNWIALEHFDVDNSPFANLGYKIFFENNQVIQGKLDEHGKAHHENVPEKAIRVEYEENNTISDEPWDTFDSVLAQLNNFEK